MNAQIRKQNIDGVFLGIVIALLTIGMIVFISASLSILATNEAQFYRSLFSQIALGFFGGGLAMYVTSKIKYTFWKKWAPYVFAGSVLLVLLLFIPGLGMEHGGAVRWIDLGFISFQPAELLKVGVIIFMASIFSEVKRKVYTLMGGFLPFIIIIGLSAILLLLQPDTGTFLVICVTGAIVYFTAGARWRDIFALVLLGVIGLGLLVSMRPYLLDRVKTFIDPNSDLLGASYQIRQSKIAIGSGGIIGRGLGQSVQKFQYLPEQTGDSVFAIYAEEFGFIGTVTFVLLLLLFFLRGFRIAHLAPNMFGRLLASGLVMLIAVQSLVNIAAIVGIIPLTGLPLSFMSQGGTALAVTLAQIGIILNISKYKSRFKKEIV